MDEIDITVSDPPFINLQLYDLFLAGVSIEDCYRAAFRELNDKKTFLCRGIDSLNKNYSDQEWMSLVRREVDDQHRLVIFLEHYISQPLLLTNPLQVWFHIPSDIQISLIEKYYSYDDTVMREVINKKLVKSRKDLDEISETTGLPLIRVTRQFDNMKRMYSLLEESKAYYSVLLLLFTIIAYK